MKITIPIIPKGQMRARHGVRNGYSRTYKHKNQKHEEHAIMSFLAQHVPAEPLNGPVALTVTAYMPIPKSKPKYFKAAAMAGKEKPTTKPDLDNCIKNIKDCLTTMRFWGDDKQVVSIMARKEYSDSPRWEIEVREAVAVASLSNTTIR